MNTFTIKTIATKPYSDQKPGTSGLRKKTPIFMEGHYLHNFIQLVETEGNHFLYTIIHRFYSREAIQIILRIAAGNGVGHVWVAHRGLLSTPAISAVIRTRENGIAYGGFILTASHNPGGLNADFGVKFNGENGAAAAENITDGIYKQSLVIKELKMADIPEVDIDVCGKKYEFMVDSHPFTVEIISSTDDYIRILKSVFDFTKIATLFQRKDFHFHYDAINGVSGAYAKPIFHDILGAEIECLFNCVPKPDFGGCHPDPNLTYAKELVHAMGLNRTGEPIVIDDMVPDFGCATDGDADRAMILGKHFFVSPSDSLAMVAAFCSCIPYFASGLTAVARSMPTSSAVDVVSSRRGIRGFEVPTGWKFFGNLMDSGSLGKQDNHPFLCGEESFGLGSDHIREKDGIFAILCWLSILADHNPDPSKPFVSVQSIAEGYWREFGRHYYTRYDYEGVETEQADHFMASLQEKIAAYEKNPELVVNGLKVVRMDEFEYQDPVDDSVSSHQGIRIYTDDGSRVIFRLSGTGSSGATIRMYMEKYETAPERLTLRTGDVMKTVLDAALELSCMEAITGRDAPSVIT